MIEKEDTKPRTFISHDQSGLFLWLSRTRPKFNLAKNVFECPDAPHIRLPYSWYGHMLLENSCIEIDIETAGIDIVKRRAHKRRNLENPA